MQNLLRSSEFVEESKFRNLSGKTGSLMYMAPEVHRYKKYNEKVSVFGSKLELLEVHHVTLLLHLRANSSSVVGGRILVWCNSI